LDENKFTVDEIHEIMYDLSYLVARATRGVNLAAPAFYADLACEHARSYLEGLYNWDSASSATGSTDQDAVFTRAQNLWGNGPTGPMMKDRMFYL